jgi:hypothetical protein
MGLGRARSKLLAALRLLHGMPSALSVRRQTAGRGQFQYKPQRQHGEFAPDQLLGQTIRRRCHVALLEDGWDARETSDSLITTATTAPERNVSAAIDVIAHDSPKLSAIRPAESAPIA